MTVTAWGVTAVVTYVGILKDGWRVVPATFPATFSTTAVTVN